MLQAVVLAGGAGTRLRPLTCDIPKPMARLLGKPNLDYILDLLQTHSVTDAAVTLQYLPHRVTEHFTPEHRAALRLSFVQEEEPLGTAGGVRAAARAFALGQAGDALLVVSGDAMCDFNLSAALECHKKANATATLVVKRVDDPRDYGLVVQQNGMVRAFVEKPSFLQAVSQLANTGVYVLSREALACVPTGKQFDFARDLFPRLLQMGRRIAVYEDPGYWCDIGDIAAFRRCQQDILRGLVHCTPPGIRDEAGNLWKGTRPTGSYTVRGPVYVGENVKIGEQAVLEACAVLEDGAFVGDFARVSGAVLGQNAVLGRFGMATGAVLCAGAQAQKGAMLFEDAVLGANARLGAHSTLLPGVRIWMGKQVPEHTVQRNHIKYGGESPHLFEENGLCGQAGACVTPELAAQVGLAVGGQSGTGRVGLAHAGGHAAMALHSAALSGVLAAGADALDLGACFEAMFRFGMSVYGLRHGIYTDAHGAVRLALVGAGGLPAERDTEREAENRLRCGEFTRRPAEAFGTLQRFESLGALYGSALLRQAPYGLTGIGVTVRGHSPAASTLRKALSKLGAREDDALTVGISSSGTRGALCWQGGRLTHLQLLALGCLPELRRGGTVALPFYAPRVAEQLAAENGGHVLRYSSCPTNGADREARALAATQPWSRDALLLMTRVLALAQQLGIHPRELGALLPGFATAQTTAHTAPNPAHALEAFASSTQTRDTSPAEGVLLQEERGVVLLAPQKRGGGIRLLAQAQNAEIARELCTDYRARIEAVADNRG